MRFPFSYNCFMLIEGHSPVCPEAQRLSDRGRKSKREREEEFCKVQISPVSVGGDIGDVQRMAQWKNWHPDCILEMTIVSV